MIDKIVTDPVAALCDLQDGATVLIGGFGAAGEPHALIGAVLRHGAKDLVVVSNGAGSGDTGIAALLQAGRVRKLICSFPRTAGSDAFDKLYSAGRIELELVPQGTLTERIRAAAAGIGGFYVKTAVGTDLAVDKEVRELGDELYVFETPIHADLALIKADRGDRWGNLTYHAAARNFGPVMAAAGRRTIAEVREVTPLGTIDPEHVVTPGIFVDAVWQCAQ